MVPPVDDGLERRFRSPAILLAVIVFLGTLIAQAPASLIGPVLRHNGVSFSKISGVLWRGNLEDVSRGAIYIGDVKYRLAPLSIFIGTMSAHVETGGGALRFKGLLHFGLFSRAVAIENGAADFTLDALSDYSIFGLPYRGRLGADITRFRWTRSGCGIAEMRLQTDILNQPLQRLIDEGMTLDGQTFCDRNSLAVELTGQNSKAQTNIAILVAPDMRYQLTTIVRPRMLVIRTALENLGFEQKDDTFVYDAAGELRGLGS